MNAKVAAVGIFVIVGFLGTRVVIFMQEADQQINKQAYEDGFYQMPDNGGEEQEYIPVELEGLPPSLQPSLDVIMGKDAESFKAWLKQYRPYIKEPKLSEIELDYQFPGDVAYHKYNHRFLIDHHFLLPRERLG